MDSVQKQRKLIPRGAQPRLILQQKLAEARNEFEGKAVLAGAGIDQCDSGFGDDEELRSRSIEIGCEKDIRSVEERTHNLSIDDPETNIRHSSPDSTQEGLSQSEELYLNYAQRNDVRYLLAQDHARRLLFAQDDDGDT